MHDKVIDENDVLIFSDTPDNTRAWCLRRENRKRVLWVVDSKTGLTVTIDDYNYRTEDTEVI